MIPYQTENQYGNPKCFEQCETAIMLSEVWRPVRGFEYHYDVSNHFEVRSHQGGCILQQKPDRNGCPCVRFHCNGRTSRHKVRDLVIAAF
jgi:hypothetical protein